MKDENSNETPVKDLLGDPVDLRHDNIGRPPFEITEEKQQLVATMRANKWTIERIARYLKCDPKTLRNHFSRELDEASDIIEGLALETILKKAKDGNVSAARKLQDIAKDGRALPPSASTTPATATAPEATPEPKLGKKEQILKNAKNPGAAWGDLLNHDADNGRPN